MAATRSKILRAMPKPIEPLSATMKLVAKVSEERAAMSPIPPAGTPRSERKKISQETVDSGYVCGGDRSDSVAGFHDESSNDRGRRSQR